MTGYVSEVEFADGHVWVPSRRDLDSSPLLRVTAPSPEEQRLADIYLEEGPRRAGGGTQPLLRFLRGRPPALPSPVGFKRGRASIQQGP